MRMGHDTVIDIVTRLDLRDEVAALGHVYDYHLNEKSRRDAARKGK